MQYITDLLRSVKYANATIPVNTMLLIAWDEVPC